MAEQQTNQGWQRLRGTNKAHYIVRIVSLCGRWLSLGGRWLEQHNDDDPDNCAECKRRLKAAGPVHQLTSNQEIGNAQG